MKKHILFSLFMIHLSWTAYPKGQPHLQLESPGHLSAILSHLDLDVSSATAEDIRTKICNVRPSRFEKMMVQGILPPQSIFPQTLVSLFRDEGVTPWCFRYLPDSYWDTKEHRQEFLWAFGALQGWKPSYEPFYEIAIKDIKALGGATWSFARRYNHVYELLVDTFPEYQWLPWQLKVGAPQGFWQDTRNCQWFLNHVSQKEGWTGGLERLYQLDSSHLEIYQGVRGAVDHGSYQQLVAFAFPEHSFQFWKFKSVPKGFWNEKTNRQAFLEDIAKNEGWEGGFERFYQLNTQNLKKYGGSGFLSKLYNSSIIGLLEDTFPPPDGVRWWPFLFSNGTVPKNYWNNKENLVDFINYIAKEKGWSQQEDFYNLTLEMVKSYGGGSLVAYYGHPSNLLEAVFGGTWKPWLFQGGLPQGFWKNPDNVQAYNEWYRTEHKGEDEAPKPTDARVLNRLLGYGVFITAKIYEQKRLEKLNDPVKKRKDRKKTIEKREYEIEHIIKVSNVLRKYEEKRPQGVYLDEQGFPDFDPYVYRGVTGQPVKVAIALSKHPLSKSRKFLDRQMASEMAVGLGLVTQEELTTLLNHPTNPWVWHHHQDCRTMMLVPEDLHRAIPHLGGYHINARKNPPLSSQESLTLAQ